MGFVVLVFIGICICFCLMLIGAATSNSQVKLVEQDSTGNFKKTNGNKKTFPSMKKGSKFLIEGRTAEKISDTMYMFTDTMEQMYWLARDMYYYQMIFEPTHSYEAVDSGGKTESYTTPETTYIAPIVTTPPVSHSAYEAPAPAPVSSHSSHSYSSPSHSSHSSYSSHSSHSCSGSSSSHSCSSSSSSSCSSSSSSCSSCSGGGGGD